MLLPTTIVLFFLAIETFPVNVTDGAIGSSSNEFSRIEKEPRSLSERNSQLAVSSRKQEQDEWLNILIVDKTSNAPIANAEITEMSSQKRAHSNENGESRLRWASRNQLLLRVRQIGFVPFVGIVRRSGIVNSRVLVRLERITYVTSYIRAKTYCSDRNDSASQLPDALEQLRYGAEKYKQSLQEYRFVASVERRTGVFVAGKMTRTVDENERFKSETWETAYRPGAIVERSVGTFKVPLLFLSTLADSSFWDHHCFEFHGMTESPNGVRGVRIDFSPNRSVNGPDWAGTVLLDSATSLLRRVEFRVTNLERSNDLKRLEGYSTFLPHSALVVMPDSTVAIWWIRGAVEGPPDFAQSVHVKQINFTPRFR